MVFKSIPMDNYPITTHHTDISPIKRPYRGVRYLYKVYLKDP